MIFKSGYFTFAGRNSRMFDLIMTAVDQVEESSNRVVGLNRTVNSNKGGVIDVTDEEVEFEIQMAFIRNGVYFTPTKTQLQEVERWLFRYDEPMCLYSSTGISYYVIFTEGSYNSNGYYTCKVLSQPYCYTSVYVSTLNVAEEKIWEEKCRDIVGLSPTVIEIKSVVDEIVTITNRDKSFSVDMLEGEIISLDSNNKEVISNMDGIYNRFRGEYIDLYFGMNRVHIKTSGTEITKIIIKSQDRLSLGGR